MRFWSQIGPCDRSWMACSFSAAMRRRWSVPKRPSAMSREGGPILIARSFVAIRSSVHQLSSGDGRFDVFPNVGASARRASTHCSLELSADAPVLKHEQSPRSDLFSSTGATIPTLYPKGRKANGDRAS